MLTSIYAFTHAHAHTPHTHHTHKQHINYINFLYIPTFYVRFFEEFLTELGDALHIHGMELTICVASWSSLLADYKTLAASSVDELQLMSTYSNPSNYKAVVDAYFDQVDSGAGSLAKAGVGIGIYYDGRNGTQSYIQNTCLNAPLGNSLYRPCLLLRLRLSKGCNRVY